jgi:peroxiredoxin
MVLRSLPRAWMLTVALTLVGLVSPALAVVVGDPAPAFSLYDVDSQSHSLSAYNSHPVLLMFFDYDDPTSITIAPLVQSSFYDTYASRGLIVLGIDCGQGAPGDLESFANETGALFPLLMDGASTRSQYDVPTNSFVLIDNSGTIRFVALGPGAGGYNEAAMKTAVENALREANTTKAATWGLIKNLYK